VYYVFTPIGSINTERIRGYKITNPMDKTEGAGVGGISFSLCPSAGKKFWRQDLLIAAFISLRWFAFTIYKGMSKWERYNIILWVVIMVIALSVSLQSTIGIR